MDKSTSDFARHRDCFGYQRYANSSSFRLILSRIGLVPSRQFTNNLNPDLICNLQRNLINAAKIHCPRIFEKCCLLHFVAFFHVASLFSTGVDNEKVGVDNEKALELTNSTVFHRGRQ